MALGRQQRKIELSCARAAVSPGALAASWVTRLEWLRKVTGHRALCLILCTFNLVMAAIPRAALSGHVH